MKLSEALSLRKDLQTRITQLASRLDNNVVSQEGDEPAENPKELLAELKSCIEQFEYYIYCINATNMQVTNDKGVPLTKLLAKREALSRHIQVLQGVFNTASSVGSNNRYSRTEIKSVANIDIKPLRKQVDELSQQYRLLDIEIQTMNFKYELIEE